MTNFLNRTDPKLLNGSAYSKNNDQLILTHPFGHPKRISLNSCMQVLSNYYDTSQPIKCVRQWTGFKHCKLA